MFELFEEYIHSKIELTHQEFALLRSLGSAEKLRRRQLILQAGEVCRHKTFVCKGMIRTFLTNDDGSEYIMRFVTENQWTLDPESYNLQLPSKFSIDALEDTEIIRWSKENIEKLFAAIPAFKEYSDNLISRTVESSQDRILMNISFTAEEKYQAFITSFPDVFRRVPLHMVASYLGVSRETLSRIRHTQYAREKANGLN